MPDSVPALTVFLLAIVPGFLGIRGYARRTSRTVPERDLYALAGAVVISVIWLGLVWLGLLALGDPLRRWGLSPYSAHKLESHRADAVWLGLGVMFVPFVLGALSAILLDKLSMVKSEKAWRRLRRTGLFRAPSAWDRAWSRYARQAKTSEVLVHLSGGLMIRGAFGKRSQVDLSPSPPGLYLEAGFAYRTSEDGRVVALEATAAERGIYLAGSQILAVYFDEEVADGAGAGEAPSKLPRGGSPPVSPALPVPAEQQLAEEGGGDR